MGLIIKRRVALDLSRRGVQVTVPFSVGDRVAYEVIFTLRDGSEQIELPPGVTAAVAVKNGYNDGYNDGSGCVDACVIDHVNNTITYTPTPEALSVEGNIECTLHVFDADGAVIGAPTFLFAVSEGDNADTEGEVSDALEASSSWSIIAATASKAEAAATSAGAAATSAGDAARSAGEAAASAGDAAGSALSARQSMDEAEDAAKQAAEQAAAQVLEKTNENAGRAEAAAGSCEDMVLGMQELYELAVGFSEEAKAAADSANHSYLFAQQEADRATEYGTSLLVQEIGNDDRKVMSQDASTKAFVGRSEVISYIIQEIAKIVANAPTDFDTLKEIADYIASDKTAAAEIESKLSKHDKEILDNRTAIENLPELVQETGDREDAVMSQKATTQELGKKLNVLANNNTNQIYGVNPQGEQTSFLASATGLYKYSIPMRGEDFNFKVKDSTDAQSCATRGHVDLGNSPRYCPIASKDEGSQQYNVELYGVSGSANEVRHRTCIVPCNGHECAPSCELILMGAKIFSLNEIKLFRRDSMGGQIGISSATGNNSSIRIQPEAYAPSNWMLVVDFYYFNNGSERMLYVSISGGEK